MSDLRELVADARGLAWALSNPSDYRPEDLEERAWKILQQAEEAREECK